MALSYSLLWFLGGLRKLSGLLMDQGPPRRCGCLGGAGRVGNWGGSANPFEGDEVKIKT